ncbi:MAG: hypothetical protein A2Z55_03565 [Burkholderiales bacterium RIFCSPHIGHO2_12_63_9]|nr:MAG: hypothetical protein A2Z55_03565 [Burkholderiales bacterium RIFCSPHIGHO2_12_63_9]
MKIIANSAHQTSVEGQKIIDLPNDADPLTLDLAGVARIDLHFPKFSDGRAFSQARLLRQRLKFAGEIRATGDVLIDQLAQMQRSGFSQAVLRNDQSLDHGRKLLAHYPAFYQGDAVHTQPHFAVVA